MQSQVMPMNSHPRISSPSLVFLSVTQNSSLCIRLRLAFVMVMRSRRMPPEVLVGGPIFQASVAILRRAKARVDPDLNKTHWSGKLRATGTTYECSGAR